MEIPPCLKDDVKGHLLNPDGTVMTCIAMGQLYAEQELIVRRYVQGHDVHDLGAGQLGMSKKLIELGAHTVTAVDKDYESRMHLYGTFPRITLVGETFEQYARHEHYIDVAFVCWPECYQQRGIVRLLMNVRTIIYLGTNFDGTACGSTEMWEHLRHNEVLAYVPHRFNNLIVYNGTRWIARRPLPEEYAGLHRDGPPLVYGEDYEDPLRRM